MPPWYDFQGVPKEQSIRLLLPCVFCRWYLHIFFIRIPNIPLSLNILTLWHQIVRGPRLQILENVITNFILFIHPPPPQLSSFQESPTSRCTNLTIAKF